MGSLGCQNARAYTGTVASDSVFDFGQSALCKVQSEQTCSPSVSDFTIDSVGMHSPSANRLEEWGSIGLDSSNINVYSQDSIASGLADLQWRLDSSFADMQTVGDTDAVESDVPWDRAQPGEILEAITVDAHYALLVPIGTYQGDGYSKYAFYWTYQDDGSSNLFDPASSSIRKVSRKGIVGAIVSKQKGVDGLGRVRFGGSKAKDPSLFLYSSPKIIGTQSH